MINTLPGFRVMILLVSLTLGGCGTLNRGSGSRVELVDRDGLDLIAAPAGHVSVVVKSSDSKERTCGGRMPDAIMDSSVGLSLPGKGIGVGSNNTDLALGGRSPQVLIIRELLYRLCEIGLNDNLSAKDMVELYKDTLPLVEVALKSSTSGTASVAAEGVTPTLVPPASAASPATSSGSGDTTSSTSFTSSTSSTSSTPTFSSDSATQGTSPDTSQSANPAQNSSASPAADTRSSGSSTSDSGSSTPSDK